MQIVIQNSGVSEYNARAVFEAAQELEIPTHGVGIIPSTYELVGTKGIDFSKPTFFYGSTRMLEIAKRDYPKYVFFNDDFDVMGAVPTSSECRRDDMLNPSRAVAKIKRFAYPEVLIDWLEKIIQADAMFIRPNSSLKYFPGLVVNKHNYKDIWERTDFQYALETHGEEDVVISGYKDIWAEWRFFVVDGDVVAGSLYKESGRLELRPASKDIMMIAQAATRKWLPDPTCVMDMALTTDGMKVVEFNAVHSSGMYEANVKSILKALQEIIC